VIPPPSDRTLIDELLAEQRRLTAVEKFSRAHDGHALSSARYRDLLPASPPAPGQQYAFEVNLDQCSGCKACVTACHSLNGLDDGEAWRDIGGLVSEDWRQPFTQTVTTACHHCADPGCLNGCPVLAYEKDPITGIVRHLDDQCIGCQYCVLKCPYEVPKYSEARGIVRKCDMCSQRLAVGEAPACVQACPNEAISITLVGQRNGEAVPPSVSPTGKWLPGSPDPEITKPTTRFVSERGLPERLVPGSSVAPALQHAHWPLVLMLVLTQLAVGVFVFLGALPLAAQPLAAFAGTASLMAGLGASVFHLGRPLKAWRAFLGWRRSWMSREILAFNLFAPLAITGALALNLPPNWSEGLRLGALLPWLIPAAALAGLLSVFCSAMIYHDTHRACWRGARSIGRFFGTTAILGLAVLWAITARAEIRVAWLPLMLALAAFVKLAGELRSLRHGESDLAEETWPANGDVDAWVLARHARLLSGKLALLTRMRVTVSWVGGVVLPLAAFLPGMNQAVLAVVALTCCFFAELAERYSFFRAVVFPRMPGV
jgi:formate dehydrogenase iron-sulfur subunit